MRRLKIEGVVLCALMASACTGLVGSGSSGADSLGGSGNIALGSPSPSSVGDGKSGSGSSASSPGATTPQGTPADPTLAGTMVLRHLSQVEYLNTIRDLLKDTSLTTADVPAESPIGNFDTFPFLVPDVVGSTDANAYSSLATTLAANAVANISTLLTCKPTAGNTASESACLTTFLGTFGVNAYRRPLTATEISGFQALYQAGRTTLALDFTGAIDLLIEEMLQSPGFLYHWEEGPSKTVHDTTNPNVIQLDPYAVASRLSYYLTSTMPDQTLLAAAAAGQLSTAAQISAQAQRLLQSSNASAAVQNFFEQLFQVTNLPSVSKDPTAYPNYDGTLVTAMDAEFRAFFSSNVLKGSGLFSDLFTSKSTVVNQELAKVYGLTGVTGTAMQPVTLDANRSGFLTMPAFLAVNGASNDSNGIYRGHAVFMQALCNALTPPANVMIPTPPPPMPGQTMRQVLDVHGQQACAKGCHSLMDPLGFAFENYDGIGQYRTTDNGSPVNSVVTVSLDGATLTVNNGVELASLLSTSSAARQCFATQWVRYAVGRPDTADDAASIGDAYAAFAAKNFNVRDLLVGIAASRTFRFRTPAAGEMLQ
jgi:Protein of unknown function (DUF1592)/Protein of unknown function (DUF1588)/Protein of unknown function (DUF1595)/Protein of unknown function (DUF1585)/Protein of unknown function (DUF1587)